MTAGGFGGGLGDGLSAGGASTLLGAQDAQYPGPCPQAIATRSSGAQAIYRAESRKQAQQAFQQFRLRWQSAYGSMVKQLEKDLPELLNFFDCPKPVWKKVRTTNLIERCFVEGDAAHGRWWFSLTLVVLTESSMPSFRDLIMSGKTAPLSFLHTQLDVTTHRTSSTTSKCIDASGSPPKATCLAPTLCVQPNPERTGLQGFPTSRSGLPRSPGSTPPD